MRSPASRHRPGFWILLWAVTIAAELGALLPESSGAALRRRRGRSRFCSSADRSRRAAWSRGGGGLGTAAGRLMVATGLSFLAGPLLEQFDSQVMQTLSLLVGDLWIVLLVVLLLAFPSGRPLRSATDRVLVGALAFSYAVLGVVWLLFLDDRGNLLAIFPDADTAHTIDTIQRALGFAASLGTFAVLAGRWWVATPPLRRAMLPSFAGGVSLLLFAALLASDIVTGVSHPLPILTWAGVAACPHARRVPHRNAAHKARPRRIRGPRRQPRPAK